jgi:hypothetical protein
VCGSCFFRRKEDEEESAADRPKDREDLGLVGGWSLETGETGEAGLADFLGLSFSLSRLAEDAGLASEGLTGELGSEPC